MVGSCRRRGWRVCPCPRLSCDGGLSVTLRRSWRYGCRAEVLLGPTAHEQRRAERRRKEQRGGSGVAAGTPGTSGGALGKQRSHAESDISVPMVPVQFEGWPRLTEVAHVVAASGVGEHAPQRVQGVSATRESRTRPPFHSVGPSFVQVTVSLHARISSRHSCFAGGCSAA